MNKVLITGIAGGQGRLVAQRMSPAWRVVGVDRVGWDSAPADIDVHTVDIRKSRFQDVFRSERPDAVVHLASVRHFRGDPALRHKVNVEGTRRVLECAAEVGVRRIVVVSSHYVYGALADNPRYMDENHPLNASRMFPEIRDLTEVEGLVGTFLWRHPEIRTTVLRPVNTLGHHVHSAFGSYLKLPVVPTVAGFDPMTQLLHEDDLADAIALAVENDLRGVYNVAGSGAVPLSVVLAELGRSAVPIPDPLAHKVIETLFDFSIYKFPPGALDYLKYPCTVSDAAFREATGYCPRYPLSEVIASARR